MKGLTERQEVILSYIRETIAIVGKPPTVRAIAQRLGVKSPNAVTVHLRLLEKKGILWRENGRITLCQ